MENYFVLMKNREEFDTVNEFYDKGWSFVNNEFTGYSSKNIPVIGNNWVYNQYQVDELIKEGVTQLSYDEWYKIFINQEPNYEIY